MYLFFLVIFIYLILAALIYGYGFIGQSDFKQPRNDFIYLSLTMGLLLILNCLRSLETGNDTSSYYALFNLYVRGDKSAFQSAESLKWAFYDIEPGYILLNKCIGLFTDNYQIFISVIAIILYFSVMRMILKYSENVGLSSFLFFLLLFHAYINVLRQCLAISVLLYAFDWLIERKYAGFLLAVLVAATFHKTAFVAIVFIFIPFVKPKKLVIMAALSCSVVISLSGAVIHLIADIFGTNSIYFTYEPGLSAFFNIIQSLTLFIVLQYWGGYSKFAGMDNASGLSKEKIITRYMLWIPVLNLCVAIIAWSFPILDRLQLYFTVFNLLSIPFILSESDRTYWNKVISLSILLCFFMIYIWGELMFRPDWMTEFNYHFFWT